MLQFRIGFDSLQFRFDNIHYICFDFVVVALNLLLHDVVAVTITKFVDDGNRAIGFHLGCDGGIVDDNLRMENLLLDLLTEVARYGSDERSLRKIRNFRGWDKGVELRAD